jgi:hypothetical protein
MQIRARNYPTTQDIPTFSEDMVGTPPVRILAARGRAFWQYRQRNQIPNAIDQVHLLELPNNLATSRRRFDFRLAPFRFLALLL